MNEKEKKLKEPFKLQWHHLFEIWILFLSIYATIYYQGEIDWQQKKIWLSKNTGISLIIATFLIIVILSLAFIGMVREWEEWINKGIKVATEKNTENLKKELLETKTELLLAQNKLREEKEKNS